LQRRFSSVPFPTVFACPLFYPCTYFFTIFRRVRCGCLLRCVQHLLQTVELFSITSRFVCLPPFPISPERPILFYPAKPPQTPTRHPCRRHSFESPKFAFATSPAVFSSDNASKPLTSSRDFPGGNLQHPALWLPTSSSLFYFFHLLDLLRKDGPPRVFSVRSLVSSPLTTFLTPFRDVLIFLECEVVWLHTSNPIFWVCEPFCDLLPPSSSVIPDPPLEMLISGRDAHPNFTLSTTRAPPSRDPFSSQPQPKPGTGAILVTASHELFFVFLFQTEAAFLLCFFFVPCLGIRYFSPLPSFLIRFVATKFFLPNSHGHGLAPPSHFVVGSPPPPRLPPVFRTFFFARVVLEIPIRLILPLALRHTV